MGSYIDSNLTSSEQILYEAKVSWWSQIGILIFSILLIILGVVLIITIPIGLMMIIGAVIRVKSTELAITNKRVIAKTGFISRKSIELKIEKIESVMIEQSVNGRLFNFGSVIVNGTGGVGTPIPFISDPLRFKRYVNEYIDKQ